MHFFALMAAAGLASAQIYKWVDERGITHYGERAPEGARTATLPNSPAAPSSANAPRPEDYRQRDLEFRQRRIRTEAAEEKQREEAAMRRQRCNHERDELRQMRDVGRLYTLNENGERMFMDQAARDAAIGRQEKLVAQLCAG